jgi:hypothetical protein
MAALSDYLESGILSHLFKNDALTRPSTIAIALTSGVPLDSDTGSSILELPSGVVRGSSFVSTNYSRIDLGDPSTEGNNVWNNVGVDNTTEYEVFSEEVDHSGYFYPLYLSEATAIAEDGSTGLSETYTFSNTFPGVTFYSPSTLAVSGSQTSGGYTSYEGNGFIKNKNQIVFNTALTDWGWVSGVAIVDHSDHGSGNLLMYAQLENPRFVYTGDSIKFDTNSLEISLK